MIQDRRADDPNSYSVLKRAAKLTEDQADKLNKWVKAVVQAVIMRMTPEGAAKQDEAASENKTMETPR